MTTSSLCTYRHITSNKSAGRGGNKICKITPHYMAAKWSGRQCADYFASTSRQASSNYCIGVDGDIAQSVDESDRAWTSSSRWNDQRAITIECGNVDNSTGEMTQATWDSLVSLCADICRRYGFRLVYTGDKNGSLTEHRMFSSTDCPGAWLHARMADLASQVNAIVDGKAQAPQAPKASSPAPAQHQSSSGIAVDGQWGQDTTRAMQRLLGTTVDGIVSNQRAVYKKSLMSCLDSSWHYSSSGGSQMIKALQARLGVSQDGICGPGTIKALQRRVGTSADGYLGPNSVRAVQTALNNGGL